MSLGGTTGGGGPDAADVFEAIAEGDLVSLVDVLIRDPSLAAARDERGISAVLQATYRDRGDIVEALLDRDPELDVFDAAALGRLDRMTALLDEDPELATAWSTDGYTPLHLGSFFGRPEIVSWLLNLEAPIGVPSRNAMAVTPLHSAAAARQRTVAELLLDRGADPNAVSHGGFTPLHSAAQNGDEPFVELLVAGGADPARRADDGMTPADLADAAGHLGVAALLRS